MSVGTAVAIGIGVSAAASIASAKMQSNAAKSAAKTQSDAAGKALGVQQQQYQQARQDFSPYQQQGASAVGRLGGMAAQPGRTFTPPGQMASLGNPGGGQMPQGPPQMPSGGGMPPQQPMGGAMPPGGPQGPPQGQMVRVQAPTGEVAMLPMTQAQAAVAKGAKILGPGGPPQGGMMPQPQGRV